MKSPEYYEKLANEALRDCAELRYDTETRLRLSQIAQTWALLAVAASNSNRSLNEG